MVIGVWKSLGGKFGESADATDLDNILYRNVNDTLDDSGTVRTTDLEVDCDFDYHEAVTVGIVSDGPYPLAILYLIPRVQFFGDSE